MYLMYASNISELSYDISATFTDDMWSLMVENNHEEAVQSLQEHKWFQQEVQEEETQNDRIPVHLWWVRQ